MNQVPLGRTPNDLEIAAMGRDGERIVFTTSEDLTGGNPQGVDQIFLYEIPSGDLRQLSDFKVERHSELDRADQRLERIVFASRADLAGGNADGSSEVFLLEVETGRVTQVTDSPDLGGQGSRLAVISGGGSRVAFVSDDNVTQLNVLGSQIFVFDIDSGAFQQVTEALDRFFGIPALDGDGTRLAYLERERDAAGLASRLVSVDLATLDRRVLARASVMTSPALDASGSPAVFASSDDLTLGNPDRSFEIFLAEAARDDQGQPVRLRQLTQILSEEVAGSLGAPSISANGRKVFFTSRLDLARRNPLGTAQLFAFDLDNRSVSQITPGTLAVIGNQIPSSADGSRAAFVVSLDPAGQAPQSGRLLQWADCSPFRPPNFVFPQVAVGGGFRSELILTNPGRVTDTGHVLFRDKSGTPLELSLNGEAPASRLDYAIQPGGTFKAVAEGEELKQGYAEVFSQGNPSSLTGSLIFSLNGEVSVPGAVLSKEYHVFTESDSGGPGGVRSGIALANTGLRPLEVLLFLRDESGQVARESAVALGPRQGVSHFLDEFFPDLPGRFNGSLHARADDVFTMLGLRQRSDLALATLTGAPTAFPNSGSQLLFLLDTGIDLTQEGFEDQELRDLAVADLTGDTASRVPNLLEITNIHPSRSVTLLFRFFNRRCRAVLSYLVKLDCGETRRFDPFQMPIPPTGASTREALFLGRPVAGQEVRGADFLDGRFALSVTAVGSSLNIDDRADLFVPFELRDPSSACQPGEFQVGRRPGLSHANLHLCNARLMAFDYLVGRQLASPSESCQGPVWMADESLRSATEASRQLAFQASDETSTGLCLAPAPWPDCRLLERLGSLGGQQCGQRAIGPTVIVKFPEPTGTLSPSLP